MIGQIFKRIIVVALLIGLLITFAVLRLGLVISTDVTISLYGLFILGYLILESVFALLNHRKIHNIREGNINPCYLDSSSHVVNCVIPGFNEDPCYYRACLSSYMDLSEIENVTINRCIFLIDGLESDGQGYMMELFKEVYGNKGQVVILSDTLRDKDRKLNFTSKYVCILQPHRGKRDALYTGFKLSIDDLAVTAVVTSDSDSIMDKDSIIELAKMFKDNRVGSATGYVAIFNSNTVISYMSKLRYFFASHLERAYESYTGNVLCMSGPLSIYRTSILSEFLLEWINQSFMGKPCTYGDDRHLTNKILDRGYHAVFTPYAKCFTETPTSLTRFLKQQLRWNKSSVREMGLTMKFLHKRSIWMTIDVAYQTLYSLFIFGSIIYIVYGGSVDNLITYCYGLIIIAFLRSIFGVIHERNMEYFLYSYYALIYLGIMIPLRMYSLVKLTDTTWGTHGRAKLNSIAFGEWCSVTSWLLLVSGGLIRKFYVNDITDMQIYMLSGIVGYFTILYLMTLILAKVRKNPHNPLNSPMVQSSWV